MDKDKEFKEFSPEWFDTSSAAWRANKKKKGESFVYICQHICKTGKMCKRPSLSAIDNDVMLCKSHLVMERKERRHKASHKPIVEECLPDSL